MAVSAVGYGQMLIKALNKEIDWDTDTIKVMLCTSSYVPNQDTHVYKSSVTNEVANGNGYTTGGITLTTKTITYTAGTNTIVLDADDVTWATSSITARYGVIYCSTGVDATSVLIGLIDFGQDFTSSNGDFKITFNASGILNIVVA